MARSDHSHRWIASDYWLADTLYRIEIKELRDSIDQSSSETISPGLGSDSRSL